MATLEAILKKDFVSEKVIGGPFRKDPVSPDRATLCWQKEFPVKAWHMFARSSPGVSPKLGPVRMPTSEGRP